jgi:hypothetical protein
MNFLVAAISLGLYISHVASTTITVTRKDPGNSRFAVVDFSKMNTDGAKPLVTWLVESKVDVAGIVNIPKGDTTFSTGLQKELEIGKYKVYLDDNLQSAIASLTDLKPIIGNIGKLYQAPSGRSVALRAISGSKMDVAATEIILRAFSKGTTDGESDYVIFANNENRKAAPEIRYMSYLKSIVKYSAALEVFGAWVKYVDFSFPKTQVRLSKTFYSILGPKAFWSIFAGCMLLLGMLIAVIVIQWRRLGTQTSSIKP